MNNEFYCGVAIAANQAEGVRSIHCWDIFFAGFVGV